MKLNLLRTSFEVTETDRIRTDVYEVIEGSKEPYAAQCHYFGKNNGAGILWGSAPCVGGAPCEKRLVFGPDEETVKRLASKRADELRGRKPKV